MFFYSGLSLIWPHMRNGNIGCIRGVAAGEGSHVKGDIFYKI